MAGQLREMREYLTRDGALAAATARHAHGAEKAVVELEAKSEERHKELLVAIKGVSDALADVSSKVVDLDLQIGKEPAKIDLTRASQCEFGFARDLDVLFGHTAAIEQAVPKTAKLKDAVVSGVTKFATFAKEHLATGVAAGAVGAVAGAVVAGPVGFVGGGCESHADGCV